MAAIQTEKSQRVLSSSEQEGKEKEMDKRGSRRLQVVFDLQPKLSPSPESWLLSEVVVN